MRKIYFLLFAAFSFLGFSNTLFSQTITIGTGTATQAFPLNYYYGYGRSSMTYTAAEMGTTGTDVSVLSIAFDCGTAANTGPTTIYLKEVGATTTQASTTWTSKTAGASTVYAGTPGNSTGFRVITLTAPFSLSANQNLEVMVECNFGGTGNGNSDGNKVKYTVATSGHQYWRSDDAPPTGTGTVTDNRPNIQLVFGPPIPCVGGSLSGGTTQSSVVGACPGSSFDLSVTGASFGAGITFQWESSADGSTGWTPIASATATSISTTQSTATYYRRKMTCSGNDAYSTVIQVTQNPPTECYCTPTASSCALDDVIENVTLGTLNNSTGCAVGGYTNFAGTVPIPALSRSLSYPLSVSVGVGGGDNVGVWIDYDQSGVFDASEFLSLGTGSGSTINGTLNIPLDATLGNTRMRVRVKFLGTPFAAGDACTLAFFGETEDYIVSIGVAPACPLPASVSAGTLTTTSAVVNWAEPASAPSAGYGWELRTSGAAGSGASGLAASGTTAMGTTTVSIPGLLPNTGYTFYVRSVCVAGTIFSPWTNGYLFRTLCNQVNTYPYHETFESDSPTRDCWKVDEYVNGALSWAYGAGSGNGGDIFNAHDGDDNAQFFGDGSGSVTKLVSPSFNLSSLTTSGADLVFWYSNQNWDGDQNELRVYYKTSAAGEWKPLPDAVYTTNVGDWKEVEIQNLPELSGDYYIAFEGTELFGFGVNIDDVTIKAAPSCRKPTEVSIISPTSSTAKLFFTSPAPAFVVEYGAPGFVPGTGDAAGEGTVVPATASPVSLSGLTSGTEYDVYIRSVCVPGTDYSENVMVSLTTQCDAVGIPYAENIETANPPTGFPGCTSMQDMNGNSGAAPLSSGGRWITLSGDPTTSVSPSTSLMYLYDASDATRAADDWFFTQGLNLAAGKTYRLKFFYKASDGPTWTEKLEVKYGAAAEGAAMTNLIYSNNDIATSLDSPFDSSRVDFTPTTGGVYYIGFHAISAADQAFLFVDDISVRAAPVVDVGVPALLTELPTCPSTNTVLKVKVRNYNIKPIDFSVNPVTVTASITGAATTSLTTVLNTGTLAPDGLLDVSLPAYSFATGLYNVTFKTSVNPATNDPETDNDALQVTFYVNPTPETAVISPANATTCAQLSTQFVNPPPAGGTVNKASGELNLAIPDYSTEGTGISSTLAVSGIPNGATVTGISVTLNAEHTYNGDLVFNLKAPNGKIYNLVSRKGGSGQGFADAVISSSATTPLSTASAIVTGTYAPDGVTGVGPAGFTSNTGTLSNLYQAGNGDWTLAVNDNANGDVGILDNWSITVSYGFSYPNVTWSPAASLYTNAAGSTSYLGGANAYAIYANPLDTITYIVTSTGPTGCTSAARVFVKSAIDVTPLPKICISDESIPLNATPAGGTWTGAGVSGNNFRPSATAVGTYPLTYKSTNAGGCISVTTLKVVVTDCPDRVTLLRDSAIVLYPNPSDGRFHIRINSVLYGQLTMKVYTNSGLLVRTQQFTGLAYGRVIPMDLTALPSGSYMVKFYYDGGVRTDEKTFKVLIGH